jgi:hypothetical protein
MIVGRSLVATQGMEKGGERGAERGRSAPGSYLDRGKIAVEEGPSERPGKEKKGKVIGE